MPTTSTRRPPAGIRLDHDSIDLVAGQRDDWSSCPGCDRPIGPSRGPVIELELADPDNDDQPGRVICFACSRRCAPGLAHAAGLAHFVLQMRRRGHHDHARQALLALGQALELVDELEAEQATRH